MASEVEWAAHWLAELAATENAYTSVVEQVQRLAMLWLPGLKSTGPLSACATLRCIFGNSFRASPHIEASLLTWNDGTVVKIAAAIYDDRRFGELPILGDALQDAGCDDAEILGHLRGSRPHVRGCWVVDLLLGKS